MFFGLMHPSWQRLLSESRHELEAIENQLRGLSQITPAPSLVMRAFEQPLDEVKLLILGQDPYPSAGVACGLAFAVSDGTKLPQSLKNLMKELDSDLPGTSNSGNIAKWSEQGVLLLNTALTTEIGKPGAHSKLWHPFVSNALAALDASKAGELVALSLGEHAKKVTSKFRFTEVIESTHPSPLSASRGFFGSKIYSRTNKSLESKGLRPIDWSC